MAYEHNAVNDYSEYAPSRQPNELAAEFLRCRDESMYLTWRILNRTYRDHLIKPESTPEMVWTPLVKRFTITDLANPVLSTINSATYGGRVTRTIKKARYKEQIEKFMEECCFGENMPLMHRDSTAYGTSYTAVGRRKGKGNLLRLHPLSTRIATARDDISDIKAVIINHGTFERRYTAEGMVVKRVSGEKRTEPNSNYGFIPVVIGRGRWMDASTPYGQDLIRAAVEETKQITALMCDLMVLARNQSYSTLVMKGELINTPSKMMMGPWVNLRGDQDFDAKWISPDAKIEELNKIIESKFARAATQCQVPIELFVQSKSGTQQAAGAAALQHKPLYDLVIEQQKSYRDVELDLIATISAFIGFEETGVPQDFAEHRAELEVDIEFEHETHPAYNQAEVQTFAMMKAEGFVTEKKCFKNFNRGSDWEEEFETAQREYNARKAEAAELEETKLAPRDSKGGSANDRDGDGTVGEP